MAVKVLMPALSPTMSEGVINKWLVNIGDTVSAGDVLAEIETDKATMEVEAVDEGKITHLIDIASNKQIAVNSVIALINGDENEKLEDYDTKIEDKKSNQNVDSEIKSKNKNELDKKITETNSNKDKQIILATPFVKKRYSKF